MGIWDDGVKNGAEVYKQDPHISPWSVQMLQDEVQSHRIFIFVWTIVKHLESFEAESSVLCYRTYGSTFHTIPHVTNCEIIQKQFQILHYCVCFNECTVTAKFQIEKQSNFLTVFSMYYD